jgi:hypothetical protein
MGTRTDLIAGLQILEKYEPGEWVDAQHDIIYGGGSGVDVSVEDAQKLDELGWFIDDQTDCWAFFT